MRTNTGSDMSNGTSGPRGPHNHPVNEESPLLPNGSDNDDRKSFWKHVFINSKTTPGLDSHNPFVSWPAHCFNVFKVTLYSSM